MKNKVEEILSGKEEKIAEAKEHINKAIKALAEASLHLDQKSNQYFRLVRLGITLNNVKENLS